MTYRLIFAGLALGLLAAPVSAQTFGQVELRGGAFAHSVDQADGWTLERFEDINVEVLAAVPGIDEVITFGQLRPHVGATINLGDLESMAYAGVSYTLPLFDTPLFLEGSFGGAIHDGTLNNAVAPARSLSCQVLFRESLSLGAHLSDQVSVMATIEHASHGLLCGDENPGLTNLGIRFGYRF